MSSIRMRLEDPPTAIRPTAPEDAPAQLALRLSNRRHTGPWDPVRDDSFYTEAGQRLELDLDQRSWAAGSAYAFAILDTELDDRLIGRVALSNVVRGPWQNATLGYWIDKDALGKGHATRAVQLVLRNIGGDMPGETDMSTQGQPGKFTFCIAENEAESPWEPLHVEAGLPRDTSTVTVFGAEGPHNIQDHFSNTALGVLRTVAGAMGQAGSNNLLGRGGPLLSLGPEHAATIAKEGYTKQQVKEFLFEHARFPLKRLGLEYQRQQIERWSVVDAPDTMIPIVRRPEDLSVIVVGGAGKHSCWQPTFGDGTHWTCRTIGRP